MASYRGLHLGMAPASLGLLATAFSVLPLIVSLRVGRIVDERGGRAFMIGGTLVMILAGATLFAAGSVAVLLVGVGLLGAGHLTAVVAAQGTVAQGSDERTYDQRFSALAFAAALGQLIGPALGGFVAGESTPAGVSNAVLAGSGLAVGAFAAFGLVRPPIVRSRRRAGQADTETKRPDTGPGSPARAQSLRSILRTPGLLGAIIVSTCILLAIDLLITYLPALGEERGWSVSLVGGLLALRGASSMAMRFVLGALATRFGRGRLLALAMVVSAAALVAVPVVHDVPLFVVLMIAAGAGLGTGQPLTMAWVASVARPETRATALSIRLIGNRLGQLVVPAAAGALAAFGGAGAVLAAGGVLVFAGLAGLRAPTGPPRTQPGEPSANRPAPGRARLPGRSREVRAALATDETTETPASTSSDGARDRVP